MERLKAPFLGSFGKTSEGLAVRRLVSSEFPPATPGAQHSRLDILMHRQGVTAVKKEKQQGPLPRGLQQTIPSATT